MRSGKDTDQHEIDDLKDKYKKWHLVAIITLMFMFGGLVGVSLLYYSSANTVADQNDEIASLQQKISPGRAQPTQAPAQTEQSSQPAQSTAASCLGGASYSAKVGKFELTVSSPNVISRLWDGAAEGGDITLLEINQCLADEAGVIDSSVDLVATISAQTNATADELKDSFEAQDSSSTLTETGSEITIDGVQAKTYTEDGFYQATAAFFENDGIAYRISLENTTDASQAALNDVISDWSFTP